MAGLENQTVLTPEAKKPVQPNIMHSSTKVAEAVKISNVETPQEVATPVDNSKAPKVASADILSRSATKVVETPTSETPTPTGETNYRADLEKITDPTVRAIAEKAIKDFESGYNKKFQTLAQQRKELDDMKNKISTWTPQRLQQELQNPAFVQAMQILQSQAPPSNFEGNVEEWSGLNETEKARILATEKQTRMLQSELAQMRQKEEDVEIKKVYPDFEPQVVDEAIRGLSDGSITASRADIWKVVNHDKNVEKGYQFGYEDGYKKALEKLNGSTSLNGNLNVTPADQVPEDVRKGGFSSIAMWRLARSKNGSSQKR